MAKMKARRDGSKSKVVVFDIESRSRGVEPGFIRPFLYVDTDAGKKHRVETTLQHRRRRLGRGYVRLPALHTDKVRLNRMFGRFSVARDLNRRPYGLDFSEHPTLEVVYHDFDSVIVRDREHPKSERAHPGG